MADLSIRGASPQLNLRKNSPGAAAKEAVDTDSTPSDSFSASAPTHHNAAAVTLGILAAGAIETVGGAANGITGIPHFVSKLYKGINEDKYQLAYIPELALVSVALPAILAVRAAFLPIAGLAEGIGDGHDHAQDGGIKGAVSNAIENVRTWTARGEQGGV